MRPTVYMSNNKDTTSNDFNNNMIQSTVLLRTRANTVARGEIVYFRLIIYTYCYNIDKL